MELNLSKQWYQDKLLIEQDIDWNTECIGGFSNIPPTTSIATYFDDDYIKNMGDQIASLNDKEKKELQEYLETNLFGN